MTAGNLIAFLTQFPPDTPVEVGGEYGMGPVLSFGVESFHYRPRPVDGKLIPYISPDLDGKDPLIYLSNELQACNLVGARFVCRHDGH